MPFTNVWDDTQPQDTQLAKLLGQDLRNFRVDTQQRMAAISGLDASKPAFGSDAQPASWNGILFFATDTLSIYQFNNPNWVKVGSLASGPVLIFSSSAQIAHTGTTSDDPIYTTTIPALATVNGKLRIKIGWRIQAQNNAGPAIMRLSINGVGLALASPQALNPSFLPLGVVTEVLVSNINSPGTQAVVITHAYNGSDEPGLARASVGLGGSFNTSTPGTGGIFMQNGLTTDSQNFDYCTMDVV
jgi:hypothetical protein